MVWRWSQDVSVLRPTVFLRNRQRPAYIGLRGFHGLDLTATPPLPRKEWGWSQEDTRSAGMDSVYPCWTARLIRTIGQRKILSGQVMLQDVRSLHASSPGGPVWRHLSMHVQLLHDLFWSYKPSAQIFSLRPTSEDSTPPYHSSQRGEEAAW